MHVIVGFAILGRVNADKSVGDVHRSNFGKPFGKEVQHDTGGISIKFRYSKSEIIKQKFDIL